MHQHTHALALDRLVKVSDSLLHNECVIIWNKVKRQLPSWSVEFFTDPFGELNLMILPPDADDDLGPMLIVYKQHDLYMVDIFRWDEYSNAKACFTLEETAAAIGAIVTSDAATKVPASVH